MVDEGTKKLKEIEATETANPLGSTEFAGSTPTQFIMEIEPHDPTNPARPCAECVLGKGQFMCMDRSYCRVKETGKTWKKKA